MKKLTFALLPLVISTLAFAQPDPKVFASTEIVWCGLDFSKAKCIGSEGFTDPDDVKDRFFSAWNNLIISESDKYNFKEAYQKSKQIDDLSVANRRNELPDADELVINEPYSFESGTLEEIIADYDLEEANEGLGLVYVVEALNKTNEEGVMYVVFFDIASKEILWESKYSSPPRGFGLRNFWAGSVYKTLKDSGKDYEKAAKAKN
jgi:hypothetical protein